MRFGVAEFPREERQGNFFAKMFGNVGKKHTDKLSFVLFFIGHHLQAAFDKGKRQFGGGAAHPRVFFAAHPSIGDLQKFAAEIGIVQKRG